MDKKYIDCEALPKKRERGYIPDDDFNAGWNACLNTIASSPAADVTEVRHGHWEWSEHEREYLCSNCGTRFDFKQVHIKVNRLAAYCSICGAVMEESEDVE